MRASTGKYLLSVANLRHINVLDNKEESAVHFAVTRSFTQKRSSDNTVLSEDRFCVKLLVTAKWTALSSLL